LGLTRNPFFFVGGEGVKGICCPTAKWKMIYWRWNIYCCFFFRTWLLCPVFRFCFHSKQWLCGIFWILSTSFDRKKWNNY